MTIVKRDKVYIEFLRIFAAFFVIFNHTTDRGFFLFSLYEPATLQYWAYMFLSIFCKFAVPLFFAISGRLLLGRQESVKTVFEKRVLKTVLILLVFSVIFYVVQVITGDEPGFSLIYFIKQLLTSKVSYTYWYFYAYIPFLIILPVMRQFVKNLEDKYFIYIFICFIVFRDMIPVANIIFGKNIYSLNSEFALGWVTDTIFIFPVLGYFLEERVDISKVKKYLPALWAVNFAAIGLDMFLTYYRAKLMGVCNQLVSQQFHSTFVIINVVCLYLTAKYLFTHFDVKPSVRNMVESLGGASLGIYLLHHMLLDILPFSWRLWSYEVNVLHINMMLSVLSVCFGVMIAGYVITIILKKLPGFNKLI